MTSNFAFFDTSVAYDGGDGNDVVLTLTRNDMDFAGVAVMANEKAVAGALVDVSAGATGNMKTVINELRSLSARQARSAYNQLGGASLAALLDTDPSMSTGFMRIISLRLGSLRSSQENDSARTLGTHTGPVLLTAADNLSLSDAETDIDYDQLADKGEAQSYRAAIYGYWDKAPCYVDAVIGGSLNDYDTKSTITIGSTTRTARGGFSGSEIAAYLEGGYTLRRNMTFLQPLLSLQTTYLHQDGFTESGAGSVKLDVNEKTLTSVVGSTGFRVDQLICFNTNTVITPEMSLRWAHEFSHDDRVINATFAGDAGGSYSVKGDAPARDQDVMSAGVDGWIGECFSLYLHYDLSVGSDKVDHAVSAGLLYMW